MSHFENPVPKSAFNALSAVGRLLAALVQKSDYKEIHAEVNISTLNEIMQKYLEQIDENNDITKDDISVVWLSFLIGYFIGSPKMTTGTLSSVKCPSSII